MKKEIAERWVKLLRSGKYTQGRGNLKSSDGSYCCLGVLCEMYVEDHEVPGFKILKDTDPYYRFNDGVDNPSNTIGTLTNEVRAWAGMRSHAGTVDSNKAIKTPLAKGKDHKFSPYALTEMNDNGFSFEEIADAIEKRVDDL